MTNNINENISNIYPRVSLKTDNILSVTLNPDPIQQQNEFDSKLTPFFLEDLISENPITPKNSIIQIISKFVRNSKFIKKIESNQNNKNLDLIYLCNMCASHMKFFKMEKDEILFKIGDFGDKFYFLIKGRIEVLKIVENNNFECTFLDYLFYLNYLKKNKEFYMFNEVIIKNYNTFEISSLSDFDKIHLIHFKSQLRNTLVNNKINTIEDLKNYFNDYNIEFSQLEIDEEILKNIKEKKIKNSNENEKENEFLKYLLSKCKISTLEKLYFEPFEKKIRTEKKEKIIKLSYETFIFLGPGDCFGDAALDTLDHKRNATIKSDEECYLGYLNNNDYFNIIFPQKKIEKTKEITFLYDFFFFFNINFHIFEKLYYHLFICEEYNRGNFLYYCKNKPNDLIILQNGKIELNIFCSIIHLHNMINMLYDKFINGKYFKQMIENQNIITNDELIKLKDFTNDKNISTLKSQNEKFIFEMNKKRNFNLCILTEKELIGIEEIFLNISYLCNAKVISQKAIIYTLDKKKFDNMIEDEKTILIPYIKTSTNKLMSFIERIYNVKKTFIDLIKANISKDKFYLYSNLNNNENSKSSIQFKLTKPISDLMKNKFIKKGKTIKNNKKNYELENSTSKSKRKNLQRQESILDFQKNSSEEDEDNKNKKNNKQYIVIGDKVLKIQNLKNDILNFHSIKKSKSSIQIIQSNKYSSQINNEYNDLYYNDDTFLENKIHLKNVGNFYSFRLGFVQFSYDKNIDNKNSDIKNNYEQLKDKNAYYKKLKYSGLKSLLKKKESIDKNKNILNDENNEENTILSNEELKYRMMPEIVKDFYNKLKQKGYSQFFNKNNLVFNSKFNQYNKNMKIHLPKIRSNSS